MSFDWAQLSLLGDGTSQQHRPSQRKMVQRISQVLGTNLEGDPGVRHGHPGTLTCSCVHQTWQQEYFPQTLRALRLGQGPAPVVWGLSLAPGADLSSPPHPPTTLTFATMADVRRLIRAQRSQGSGLSVWSGSGIRLRCDLLSFCDQCQGSVNDWSQSSV